ncbi:MAG: hypothetical protein HFE78_08565 [Clostridiales bacterium]|nr:hypothetical protein [Clostridiales bacterium]
MKTCIKLQEFAPSASELTASGDFQEGISAAAFMGLEESPSYCAFDINGIPANSLQPFLTSTDPCGFVSKQISNENGQFRGIAPKLVIAFSVPHSVQEITVFFSEYYCESLIATAKTADNKSVEAMVKGNQSMEVSVKWSSAVPNCKQITLEFNDTQYPNQFVRVGAVSIGKKIIFDRYKSLHTTSEMDLVSADAPFGTIEVTALLDEQPENIEWSSLVPLFRGSGKMGDYLLTGMKATTDVQYEITGEDALGRLDRIPYDGGMMAVKPLETMLQELSDRSGITIKAVGYNGENRIEGHVPICTVRKALMLVAFAVQAAIFVNYDGSITLSPLEQTLKYTIYGGTAGIENRVIGNAVFEKSDPYTNVELHVYEYRPPTNGKKTLYSSDTTVTKQRVNFSNPVLVNGTYGLQISGTNAKIEEANANYAIVSGTNITLSGYEYSVVDKSYTREIAQNGNSPENTLSLQDYTLSLAEWSGTPTKEVLIAQQLNFLKKYAQSRGVVKAKIILTFDENERPIESVGDYIEIEAAYAGMIRGYITRMDYHITQNMTADIEVTEWQQ